MILQQDCLSVQTIIFQLNEPNHGTGQYIEDWVAGSSFNSPFISTSSQFTFEEWRLLAIQLIHFEMCAFFPISYQSNLQQTKQNNLTF